MTDAALLRAMLREAGALLKVMFHAPVTVDMKGLRDPVTEADRAAERLVVARLEKARPADSIVTEEALSAERGGRRWIVDPLDGTNNFAHGVPHFCVSIGLVEDGEAILGGVYDPMRDELFEAERGRGAFLNGKPIRVSEEGRLIGALLATGFAYDRNETPENNVAPFSRLILDIQDIRRMGSAALDLCYDANGRNDGSGESHRKRGDPAAGALLVREAGGRVTDGAGAPFRLGGSLVVATNGRLHEALLEKLRAAN